jgi:teichuronic acid biosynthesis glycosyltransferase TuaG
LCGAGHGGMATKGSKGGHWAEGFRTIDMTFRAVSINERNRDSMTVSIVMPAFNAQRFIRPAIDSVLGQSYQDWQLIVIDDRSTDGTSHIVTDYSRIDDRIYLYSTETNSGPAGARNVGIDIAGGRYIAFLDSDDRWFSEKLETQVRLFEQQGAVFCYSAYWAQHDATNRRILVPAPESISYDELLKGSVIGCSTVMYDTAQLGKRYFRNGKDVLADSVYSRLVGHVGHEDYALWLEILRELRGRERGRVLGIREPLAVYRIHATSFSGSKSRAALYQWIIYRRYERLAFIRSLYLFVRYALKGIAKHIALVRIPPADQ